MYMEHYTQFHGEILENKHVDAILRNYFPDYTYKGVFVDVGAFEPIRISNSYHFEKIIGMFIVLKQIQNPFHC